MHLLSKLVLFVHVGTVVLAVPFRGELKEREEQLLDSYEYVIVGGGTSGLAVANRLSENPKTTVLVIEAGVVDQHEDDVLLQRYLGNTMGSKYDWNVTTVPQTHIRDRMQKLPIGKVFGGSSVLNGLMFDRGSPADYDLWEYLGNKGWNFEGLLPYFKKSENFTIPSTQQVEEFGITWDPDVHGFDGYINSGFPNFIYPQNKNFQTALNNMGIPTSKDMGGSALNHYWSPNSLEPTTQTRSYARGYYDRIQPRPNLHAITSRQVTKLLTKETAKGIQVIGVEFTESKEASRKLVIANCEVILAAGAVHTPQILQLSGIGAKALLEGLGLPVLIDLPGVGQNYQDHPFASLKLNLANVEHSPIDMERNATYDAAMKALFYSSRQGPWTAGSPNSVAFLPFSTFTNRSTELLVAYAAGSPDAYLRPGLDASVIAGYKAQRKLLLAALSTPNVATMEFIFLSGASRHIQTPLSIALQHPFSRGYIEINSTDPFAAPVIDFRTGSNPVDLDVYVEALKFCRRVVATEDIQILQPTELEPGPSIQTDGELRTYVEKTLTTMFHPSGTASMMKREWGGVVDDRLKVYGTTNLRIVDASIQPLIPATHLQATIYAVAEKAADIIKADQ
ncbi:hypothetical protein BGX38DRAFT_1276640 [Terfezia claveryi]|nr:hypothetical protein BGX38DRAFT_1276640 [Terfezia claveryi]